MSKRYTDADKLQLAYKEIHGGKRSLLIDTAPTADVVEVVRCKDCVHRYFADNRVPSEQSYMCDYWGFEDPMPDGFCNFAERRS